MARAMTPCHAMVHAVLLVRQAGSVWVAAGVASVVSGTAVARVFQLEPRGYPGMK